MDGIAADGGNLTVLQLVEKYVETKVGVRPNTKAGYKTVINILKKEDFGYKRIDTVKISDAKVWHYNNIVIAKRSKGLKKRPLFAKIDHFLQSR